MCKNINPFNRSFAIVDFKYDFLRQKEQNNLLDLCTYKGYVIKIETNIFSKLHTKLTLEF